jgi:hypothetical protein
MQNQHGIGQQVGVHVVAAACRNRLAHCLGSRRCAANGVNMV